MLLDKTVYTKGTPCCKYILNNLKFEEDAICFVKFVVQTLRSQSYSFEDIETLLVTYPLYLDVSHPLKGFDFTLASKGYSLLSDLLLDDNVPSYRHCYDFYSKFNEGCGACLLCPLSGRYANARQDAEKRLLRFAAASENNYDYLVANGLSPKHFCSVVDVLDSVQLVEMPCYYGVTSSIFMVMRSDECWRENGVDNIIRLARDEFRKYIASYIAPSMTIVAEAVYDVTADKILTEGDVSPLSVVNADIATLLSPITKSTVDYTVIGSSNLGEGNFERLTSEPENVDVGNSSPKKKKKKKKKASLMEQAVTVPEDIGVDAGRSDVVMVDELAGHCSDVVSSGDECVGAEPPTALSIVHTFCGSSNSDTGSGEGTSGASDCEGNNDNVDDDLLCFREIKNDDVGMYLYDAPSWLDVGMRNFVGMPLIAKKELEHFALNLDSRNPGLLAMFESHVLKDKRLCVEWVALTEDNAYCLLMFSPKLHSYFYSSLGEPYVFDVIKQLLSYPSVQKFCYHPFHLLSVLMGKGVYVRNVISLFSLSAVWRGRHSMVMHECLVNMGAYKAEGGVHIKPEGTIASVPLLYMHCYPTVFRNGKKEVVKRGLWAEFEERNCFDCILGRSYEQGLYCVDSYALFAVMDSLNYRFSTVEDTSFKENGFVLLYQFKHVPLMAPNIVRGLLCRLEETGVLKKYGVLLTALSVNGFELFVVNDDCKDISTIISRELVFYLREHGLHGIEYDLKKEKAKSNCG